MKAFIIVGSLCLSIFAIGIFLAHVQYANSKSTAPQVQSAAAKDAALDSANMRPEADGAQFHAGPDIPGADLQAALPKGGSMTYETFELPEGAGLKTPGSNRHALPPVAPEWKDPSFADNKQATVLDMQAKSEQPTHRAVVHAKPDQLDDDLLILEAHSENRLSSRRR